MKAAVFFIDALGPDLITSDSMPFTYNLMKKNIPYTMNSVLGYSGGIHPSLWTSTYPDEHSQWATVVRARKQEKMSIKDKLLGMLPEALSRPINYLLHYSSISRSKILPSIPPKQAKYFGKSDYDYYHAVKDVNGVRTIFSYVPTMYRFYNKINQIKPILNQSSELDVYFTGELDHLCHLRLANLKKMRKMLRKIDSKMEELYSFYKMNFPECHFIAFSDHGQAVVRRRIDIKGYIGRLGLKFEDYIAAYDSTMVRFWVFNEKARELITRALSKIEEGAILDKKARQKYGIDFKDNRFGDIFFLLNEGCEVYPNFYHNYLKNNVQGMHGYLPESRSMKAFFLYSGPAKLEKAKEISILDVAPTILKLLKKKIPDYIRGKPLCK
ncbi:MAG TPA: alkaline phosphatase family protein [Candidatus Nanoarchaeia archaeon]|nr:alkaline phosphatase family protein [Candidatus Nanoarchaeia archaeon]